MLSGILFLIASICTLILGWLQKSFLWIPAMSIAMTIIYALVRQDHLLVLKKNGGTKAVARQLLTSIKNYAVLCSIIFIIGFGIAKLISLF